VSWKHVNLAAWSPPQRGGGVRTHGTHGGIGALLNGEAGSEAVEHMAAPEPTLAGRRGPVLVDTCWHRSPPQ
jgi:hypothetical protein